VKENSDSKNFATFIILITAIISLSLIWANTVRNPNLISWNHWAFYEWLINYQGGFVRRGLIGELVQKIFYTKEIQVINYIAFILGASYVILSVYLVLNTEQFRIEGLLYTFAPTGFFWVAISNEHYYRKEMIFYVAIFIVAVLYRAWLKSSSKLLSNTILFLITLFSLIMPFIHEAFIFFCVIFFSLIISNLLRRRYEFAKIRMIISVFVVTSIVLFFMMSIYRGDSSKSNLIWSSLPLNVKHLSGDEISGGISAIGWSTLHAISLPIHTLLSGLGTYYIFPLLVIYLITGYMYSSINKEKLSNTYFSNIFSTNFIGVCISFLPLFIFGWDWGRWVVGIFIVFSNMVFLGLLIPFERENICGITLISKNKKKIFFLFLILISIFTRTPECCIQATGGSLLDNILVANFNHLTKKLMPTPE